MLLYGCLFDCFMSCLASFVFLFNHFNNFLFKNLKSYIKQACSPGDPTVQGGSAPEPLFGAHEHQVLMMFSAAVASAEILQENACDWNSLHEWVRLSETLHQHVHPGSLRQSLAATPKFLD